MRCVGNKVLPHLANRPLRLQPHLQLGLTMHPQRQFPINDDHPGRNQQRQQNLGNIPHPRHRLIRTSHRIKLPIPLFLQQRKRNRIRSLDLTSDNIVRLIGTTSSNQLQHLATEIIKLRQRRRQIRTHLTTRKFQLLNTRTNQVQRGHGLL